MTNEEIKAIALASGFELKPQDVIRSMDLNPYVYDFAKALLAAQQSQIAELKEELDLALMAADSHARAGDKAREERDKLLKASKKVVELVEGPYMQGRLKDQKGWAQFYCYIKKVELDNRT